jgi:hypothetical protein
MFSYMFPSYFPSLFFKASREEFVLCLKVLAFDLCFLLITNQLISSTLFTSLCLFFFKAVVLHYLLYICFHSFVFIVAFCLSFFFILFLIFNIFLFLCFLYYFPSFTFFVFVFSILLMFSFL